MLEKEVPVTTCRLWRCRHVASFQVGKVLQFCRNGLGRKEVRRADSSRKAPRRQEATNLSTRRRGEGVD